MKKQILNYILALATCLGLATGNINAVTATKEGNVLNNSINQEIQTTMYVTIKRSNAKSVQDIHKDVLNEINQIDENTLVVVDIDRTLLQQQDISSLQNDAASDWEMMEKIYTREKGYSKEKRVRCDKIWHLSHGEVLTENYWIDFIEWIKSSGGKVIAITAIDSTKIDGEMRADIRAETLKKLGITFSGIPNLESQFLATTNIKSPYYSKSGIITSWNWRKGIALKKTLVLAKEKTNFIPTTIISIDDQEENINNILKFATVDAYRANGKHMNHFGYIYSGAKTIDKEFDPIMAYYQIHNLYEKETYITDSDAKKALENKDLRTEIEEQAQTILTLFNEYKQLDQKEELIQYNFDGMKNELEPKPYEESLPEEEKMIDEL